MITPSRSFHRSLMVGLLTLVTATVLLACTQTSQPKGDPVVTTASGLQYIDSAIGTGPQADSGKRLTVNYVGRLARPDSLIFDSNVLPDFGHMQPFEFRLGVGDVIKGWDQGIAGMRVGGRRRLIIPPGLAYGNRALDRIPANSTLIFDVELLSIK